MNKSKFCYLVQGQSFEMPYFQKILTGKHYKLLTWDAMFGDAIFFPKSSWAEGRKRLEEEIKIEDYDYVCFIDGDIQVISGTLEEFEDIISTLKPVCATPIVERLRNSTNFFKTKSKWMISYGSDEQFQVFSVKAYKELFNARPYITLFDTISWHFPCLILQTVLGSVLKNCVVTIKTLEVKNNNHSDYPKSIDYEPVRSYLINCGFRSSYYPLLSGYQSTKNPLKKVIHTVYNVGRLFLCSYFSKSLFRDLDFVLRKISKYNKINCLFKK